MSDADLLALMQRVSGTHKWMHIEKLMLLDGKESFTKAQGED